MWLADTDTMATLAVYQYSQLWTFHEQLFMMSHNHGDKWEKADICAPPGVYSLAFVGTVGNSYKSDIGLDDITIDSNPMPCSPDTPRSEPG